MDDNIRWLFKEEPVPGKDRTRILYIPQPKFMFNEAKNVEIKWKMAEVPIVFEDSWVVDLRKKPMHKWFKRLLMKANRRRWK